MKKLLCLIFISIFLFSCKSNENPKPTLSDRAGTYEGGSFTVIVSSIGEIQIIQNSLQVGFALFDTSSREEDFNVGTYKVELDNDPEINNIALSKINNTATIRLTLEQRAGTYTCVDVAGIVSTKTMTIGANGSANIAGATFTSLNIADTSTSFTVISGNELVNKYLIDFNNNKLIGQGSGDNNTYSISKN